MVQYASIDTLGGTSWPRTKCLRHTNLFWLCGEPRWPWYSLAPSPLIGSSYPHVHIDQIKSTSHYRATTRDFGKLARGSDDVNCPVLAESLFIWSIPIKLSSTIVTRSTDRKQLSSWCAHFRFATVLLGPGFSLLPNARSLFFGGSYTFSKL